MTAIWSHAARTAAALLAALVTLAGCASLAVRPCDTIEDRDGKYFGRFFLGVATIGLSEVTIQSEEVRQAYEGYRSCPPPPGVQVVPAASPAPAGSQAAAVATIVNGTRWTLSVYLNADPAAAGKGPLMILRPGDSRQYALLAGRHRLVGRPTGAPPGTLPPVTWDREFEIDPRVRSFRLQLNEADFK